MTRTVFFFDDQVLEKISPTERAWYKSTASQLAVAKGRPCFVASDGLPDPELDGFCDYLIDPSRASQRTWASYAIQVNVFLRFVDSQEKNWKAVTHEDLNDYYQVRVTGDFQNTPRIKPQSWNIAKTAIVHLYEYAVDRKLIPTVPFDYRKSKAHFGKKPLTDNLGAKATPEPINFISIGAYKSIWRPLVVQQENSQRNIALNDLLITVGLRISEALSLQCHQIPDPDLKVYAGKKSIPIIVKGKGKKSRTVRIPKHIIRKIRFYIAEDRAELIEFYKNYKGKRASLTKVFLSRNGNPLAARTVQNQFQSLSKKTGITLTPHGCRHTFAIYQLEAMIKRMAKNLSELKKTGRDAYRQIMNDPLRQLQLLLGHSSITSTYIYLDFLEESELLVDESLDDWTNWESGHEK